MNIKVLNNKERRSFTKPMLTRSTHQHFSGVSAFWIIFPANIEQITKLAVWLLLSQSSTAYYFAEWSRETDAGTDRADSRGAAERSFRRGRLLYQSFVLHNSPTVCLYSLLGLLEWSGGKDTGE